ncbi:MAG: hypothetical protein JOZ62_03910 [Acidobacteriaceae bacterium]|nr:hypothetical protein [Acidobacteriaceae bacterium]
MPNVFENDPMLAQIAANGRPLRVEKDPAKTTNGAARGDRQVLDDRGVSLPEEYRQELQRLRITAWRAMSIAPSSHGPVVRGTESGGAVEHIGHYVTFAAEDGHSLEWLHPQDAIAPNQTHAVVVAPALLRIEVFRLQRNYQVAITKHTTQIVDGKPKLVSSMAFRGRGFLGLELWNREKAFRGAVLPSFTTRGGDEVPVPEAYQAALKAAVEGAACVGCRHSHYLQARVNNNKNNRSSAATGTL